MKIGVISDIHGNHYALREVLAEAKKIGVDRILALGDFVGYYYHPEIVFDLLSEWTLDLIKGNHEVILQNLYENKIDSEKLKNKYGSGHEHALNNLDKGTLDWLFSLPTQQSVSIDNVTFQLNHGTPWSIDEYLYPDTNKLILDKCDSLTNDFVLMGHSHYSFFFKCDNSIIINSGSVGQSRERGGMAYWSLINTSNKTFQVRITPYDTTDLLKDVKLFDPSVTYSSEILSR
jgi:putative phosphoesterase